jgi:ATP-dependent Clp protease adapter protein ClpS
MWTNHKMTSKAFIHNDDVTCFHMVIQGIQKMVGMGGINFED